MFTKGKSTTARTVCDLCCCKWYTLFIIVYEMLSSLGSVYLCYTIKLCWLSTKCLILTRKHSTTACNSNWSKTKKLSANMTYNQFFGDTVLYFTFSFKIVLTPITMLALIVTKSCMIQNIFTCRVGRYHFIVSMQSVIN